MPMLLLKLQKESEIQRTVEITTVTQVWYSILLQIFHRCYVDVVILLSVVFIVHNDQPIKVTLTLQWI